MALNPINDIHALQIIAGINGRNSGHSFEDKLVNNINNIKYPIIFNTDIKSHVNIGYPEILLLNYLCSVLGTCILDNVQAISVGSLATSENEQKHLEINGIKIKKCKSDVILIINVGNITHNIGISTKQCSNKTPTNAQLFFTTANGFFNLLNNHNIPISKNALIALEQFCGNKGKRPMDDDNIIINRLCDPRRYFWEEINHNGRLELEAVFKENQDAITRLLLQKAYLNDPFLPSILLHKTKLSDSWDNTEVAIYTIDEIVEKSKKYSTFNLKPYSVKKGSYKDPVGVYHLAPRFGIIQMQRGGQKQHPEQLQFNLEAGYFYKIQNLRYNVVG